MEKYKRQILQQPEDVSAAGAKTMPDDIKYLYVPVVGNEKVFSKQEADSKQPDTWSKAPAK